MPKLLNPLLPATRVSYVDPGNPSHGALGTIAVVRTSSRTPYLVRWDDGDIDDWFTPSQVDPVYHVAS